MGCFRHAFRIAIVGRHQPKRRVPTRDGLCAICVASVQFEKTILAKMRQELLCETRELAPLQRIGPSSCATVCHPLSVEFATFAIIQYEPQDGVVVSMLSQLLDLGDRKARPKNIAQGKLCHAAMMARFKDGDAFATDLDPISFKRKPLQSRPHGLLFGLCYYCILRLGKAHDPIDAFPDHVAIRQLRQGTVSYVSCKDVPLFAGLCASLVQIESLALAIRMAES